jgi:hypothetical protein
MKDILRILKKETYSFLHNLKALLFFLAGILVSLALVSGISLSKGNLSLTPVKTTQENATLRDYYQSQSDLFSYYVAFLDGENPVCPSEHCATPNPALRDYYVVERQYYDYLLSHDLYLHLTAFVLSNPSDPLYEEFGENYHMIGSDDYCAIRSVAASYFVLAFALLVGFHFFHGRAAEAGKKNEAHSPISPERFYQGKLLFSFLVISLINLLFLSLSLLLGAPVTFTPLFLVYSYGSWKSVSASAVALNFFLNNEVLSLTLLSLFGLFRQKTGKQRFRPLVVLLGGIVLSMGLASLLERFSIMDYFLFYLVPVANLVFIPYGFFNWSFPIVLLLYTVVSVVCIRLSKKKWLDEPAVLSKRNN